MGTLAQGCHKHSATQMHNILDDQAMEDARSQPKPAYNGSMILFLYKRNSADHLL